MKCTSLNKERDHFCFLERSVTPYRFPNETENLLLVGINVAQHEFCKDQRFNAPAARQEHPRARC